MVTIVTIRPGHVPINCTLINLKTDDNYHACSAVAPGSNLMSLVEDDEEDSDAYNSDDS